MWQFHTALLSIAALVAAFSVRPAAAGDMSVPVMPVKAPAVPFGSPWSGLYASFSAGGSLTNANESFSDAASATAVSNFFAPTFLPETITTNSTLTTVDSQSGNNAGAVFKFAMGYNVVWSSWVVGAQSEVTRSAGLVIPAKRSDLTDITG
jgi:hypothetical protein